MVCSSFHCSTVFCFRCLKSWSTEHPQYPKLHDVDAPPGILLGSFLPLLTCTTICHFFTGLPVYNRSESTVSLKCGCCFITPKPSLFSSHISVLRWPVNLCWWIAYSLGSAGVVTVTICDHSEGILKNVPTFKWVTEGLLRKLMLLLYFGREEEILRPGTFWNFNCK